MSSVPTTRDLSFAPADNLRLVELCGPLDAQLHQIEARLGVEVRRRGNKFQIIGLASATARAEAVLRDLYARAQREPVDPERVHIALQELDMNGTPREVLGKLGLNLLRFITRADALSFHRVMVNSAAPSGGLKYQMICPSMSAATVL